LARGPQAIGRITNSVMCRSPAGARKSHGGMTPFYTGVSFLPDAFATISSSTDFGAFS
jgi:hypothetical protein